MTTRVPLNRKLLELVATDIRTGGEVRIPGESDAYDDRMAAIRRATGLGGVNLRLRLLLTLGGGPEVEAGGHLYRLEDPN